MNDYPVRYSMILLLFSLCSLVFFSCDCDSPPMAPPNNAPQNVEIVIEDGISATRDTVLNVAITGLWIDRMQLSTNPYLSGVLWEEYDSVRVFHAPRREGIFSVFGRFSSALGGTTDVISGEIQIDLTAHITRFTVNSNSDILHPKDLVHFSLGSSEEGEAYVSFGNYISNYQLDRMSRGSFYRSLTIPYGIFEDRVWAVGYFEDIAGNVAIDSLQDRLFCIRGPSLNPRLINWEPIAWYMGFDMWLQGKYCFVTDGSNSMVHIVNVVTPINPAWEASVNTSGWCYGLESNGQYLYVANGAGGLVVIGIDPPSLASIIGHAIVAGLPGDVTLHGSWAYVACFFTGLKVFDISNPVKPSEEARLPLNHFGQFVVRHESLLYVVGDGVSVVDISSPRTPVLLGTSPFNIEPNAVLYNEESLIIATDTRGVVIVDVSDPSDIRMVFTSRELGAITGLEITPPFLFYSTDNHVGVLNVSNPSPEPLHVIHNINLARAMVFKDQYLFVAGHGGMAIIEVFAQD